MKYLTFLFSVFVMASAYAQPGGGGGQRGGGGQGGQSNSGQQREIPEFDAAQMAGVFSYDSGEIIKKIKIKSDDDLELKVRQSVAKYNTRMDEISLVNTENFDSINVFMNAMRKQLRPNRGNGGNQVGSGQVRDYNAQSREGNLDDDDPMRQYMQASRQKIQLVKEEVVKEDELLNTEFESLLSEKQYKKWVKYQEKIKKENAPEERPNNQNQGVGNRGGRQGGPPGGGGNRF